jgi:hypothetical protein
MTRTQRRAWRATTVAGAAGTGLLMWTLLTKVGGMDLAARTGNTVHHIGPTDVVVTCVIAGLTAWAMLAGLERWTRRPYATYVINGSVALAASLIGPLAGATTGVRLALIALHVTVGAVLLLAMPAGAARRT